MRRSAWPLALGLFLACASSSQEAWVAALRADAAAGGMGPDTPVVLVFAEGRDAAWGRIVRARTEAALEESELLASVFASAAVAPVEVAVGGPWAELNEQVVIDAFGLAERDRLPGLRVLYVSPEPPGGRVLELCAHHRATCLHRLWRGDPPR